MTSENYIGCFIHPYFLEGQGPAISHEAPGGEIRRDCKASKEMVKDPNLERICC